MKKLGTMSALGALADFEDMGDLDGSGKVTRAYLEVELIIHLKFQSCFSF